MYKLISKMSGEVVSSHRKMTTAVEAAERFQKAVKPGCFRPWKIEKDGEVVQSYGTFETTGRH